MRDEDKTKEQLINELIELRQRNAKLEALESEYKHLVKTLQETEDKYKHLVEDSIDGVAMAQEGRIIYVNDSYCKMFGYKRDEVIGESLLKVVAPEDRALIEERAKKRFKGMKVPFRYVFNGIKKDGTRLSIEVSSSKSFIYENKPTILAILRDITERERAEEALKESEARKRILLEAIPDLIFRLSKNGTFLDFVPSEMGTFLLPDEFLGKKVYEVFSPEEARRIMSYVEQALQTNETQFVEYQLPLDGEMHDYEARYVVSGEDEVLAIVRDITEHKRMEEALHYRIGVENLITTISTNFINLSLDEVDKEINQALKRIGEFTGADRSYVFLFSEAGTKMDNTHEWCAEGIEPQIDNLKELPVASRPWQIERLNQLEVVYVPRIADLPSEASNEKEQWQSQAIQSLVTVPMVCGSSLVGFLGFDSVRSEKKWSKDIIALLRIVGEIFANALERKRAEEEIHKLNQFMESIIDNANVWLDVLDTEANVIIWNKAAEEISGYSREEVVGHGKIWEWLYPDEDYRNEIFTKTIIIEGEIVENFETTIRRKDGGTRIISWNSRNLVDEKGNIAGSIALGRDITDYEKMKEELQKIDKLESIGVLAGGIAHDFNNLLTGILGNISLAKFYSNEKKVIERLMEAERAYIQAKDLTQQLLTFSKGGTPIKETATISDLLKDTAQFTLRGSNIKCTFSIPDDLWLVEVDKGQISQVIQNLVINADHAMPTGGIIKISAENIIISDKDNLPLKEGEYIKISVSDEGIGIPKEYLTKIFDPYFTTKAIGSDKGTGLGLAICHSIIEKHGGYITVKSEVGVGTTFYIYLPASQKQILTEKEVEEHSLHGKGKILLMDDEEIVRGVAGEILKYLGYDVVFAEDGSEAIELYQKAKESDNPFDAVILDLTVPGGMGGKEAIRRFLEIDTEVRAIISSGYFNDPIMSDYKQYGFSGVIVKPYNIKELSDMLCKVI